MPLITTTKVLILVYSLLQYWLAAIAAELVFSYRSRVYVCYESWEILCPSIESLQYATKSLKIWIIQKHIGQFVDIICSCVHIVIAEKHW